MKILLLLSALLVHLPIFAAGGHDHGHATEQMPTEGPHGGRLLESEGLNLELTIFESGIPAEMRIYPYKTDGAPVAPDKVNLVVTLNRTGGQQDVIDFSAEGDYLLGDTEVVEPHSFEIEVSAEYENQSYHWHFDSYEGRAEIPQRLIELSGVETATAGPQTLNITRTVYGIVSKVEDQVFHLHAPYPGIVENVYIETGDSVKKGQKLLTVRNQQTLQSYSINSPAKGEVTMRPVKRGDHTDMGSLVEISDLSTVWIELSMFPQDIEQVTEGMRVEVINLQGTHTKTGKLDYISPEMTSGHIARARTTVDNAEGLWRPGMHLKAQITIDSIEVPLAVKRSAVQSFREMPVVFARYGTVFEVRMVQLGQKDDQYIEVLGGLAPNTEYVTQNSYLLKAEVLKDGANHSH